MELFICRRTAAQARVPGTSERAVMRPVGSLRADSSVNQEQEHPGEQGHPYNSSHRLGMTPPSSSSGDVRRGANPMHAQQQQSAMEIEDDAPVDFDLGDGGPTEICTGCCSRLSPTFMVYMSAFVSSLTSVLLGYGEGRLCSARRRNTKVFLQLSHDSSRLVEGESDTLFKSSEEAVVWCMCRSFGLCTRAPSPTFLRY